MIPMICYLSNYSEGNTLQLSKDRKSICAYVKRRDASVLWNQPQQSSSALSCSLRHGLLACLPNASSPTNCMREVQSQYARDKGEPAGRILLERHGYGCETSGFTPRPRGLGVKISWSLLHPWYPEDLLTRSGE
jgi:hypothetical protein